MIKLLCLSILLVAPSASGFSSTLVLPHRSFCGLSSSHRSISSSTRRFVSTNPTLPKIDNDEDQEGCVVDPPPTPSSVFGKPLDDDTKRRNREFIHFVKGILFDVFFRGKTVDRSFARFYALETIARMPYFSYLSVLHLYETLGLWRKADYLKVHFAESWNELHHLLIMEELGGNSKWSDRFIAQHSAFFYYWMVVTLYVLNPTHAYNLNQAVEQEAYETYNHFLETHAEYLQGEPPAKVAVKYYTGDDLYMFDMMHFDGPAATNDDGSPAAKPEPPRRPNIQTLYDVFKAVRDDEYEHVKTMAHLQERSIACE